MASTPTTLTPSDEATKEGLRLAREAGEAYARTVEYFISHVATSGATQNAGDYTIGFAVEHAEPLYHMLGGTLELVHPFMEANAHLEVVIMDRADHRFIPELDVHVTLTDDSGKEVGTFRLPFLWHPTMFHYGRSIHVPRDGHYTARVFVEAPRFPRHDQVNGKRYTEPVSVEFRDIKVTTGKK